MLHECYSYVGQGCHLFDALFDALVPLIVAFYTQIKERLDPKPAIKNNLSFTI